MQPISRTRNARRFCTEIMPDPEYGGRTVFDWEPASEPNRRSAYFEKRRSNSRRETEPSIATHYYKSARKILAAFQMVAVLCWLN
jgi:hypothetical protein